MLPSKGAQIATSLVLQEKDQRCSPAEIVAMVAKLVVYMPECINAFEYGISHMLFYTPGVCVPVGGL